MNDVIPLISVIVPIYNVAPYLRKCLDSLKNQTMKQIEVVCIDDGSTDSSGKIADEYRSDNWPKFRVFHTENKGLSAARNRGIDEAHAEWIMFVDSDDWVEPEFCRVPYETAKEYQADMVSFETYQTTEKGRIKRKKESPIVLGFISPETSIDVGGTVAWNKVYKKELFEDIWYPEGKEYEDLLTTHKLVYKAKRIIHVLHNLYYHRYRTGSITSRISNDTVWLDAAKQQTEELINFGYPQEKAKEHLSMIALKCYGRAKDIESRVVLESSEILQEIRETPCSFGRKVKLELAMWRCNKRLFRIIYQLFMRAQ